MVGVGADARRSVWALLLLSAFVLVGLSQGALGASATLERLEFEVISEHAGLPPDSAVVGDVVRIAAVLAPNAETVTADEIEVAFYYEDRITKETARIGSAIVPGFYLAAGSFRRAVVEWNLDLIRPGLYNVFAVGDLDVAIADETPALRTLTVLREGTYVGFLLNEAGRLVAASGTLEGAPVVPLCAMGETVARVHQDYFNDFYRSAKLVEVQVMNLGTSNLELADFMEGDNGEPQLMCWYRSADTDAAGFQELSNACWIMDRSLSIAPGEEKTLRLYFQYTFELDSAELGKAEVIQLKVQARDNSGASISDPVYLPEQGGEIRVFSWADLWTFPDLDACCPTCDVAEEASVSLAPVAVQGVGSLGSASAFLVFHAVDSSAGSSLYANELAMDAGFAPRYYIKETGTRWADPWQPATASQIVAVAAHADANGVVRVFVATEDGNAYGIQDTVYDPSGLFPGQDYHPLWGPVAFPGSGGLTVHNPPLVVKNANMVVFATSRGLFAYNSRSGSLLWQMTDSDKLPIVSAAGAAGHIWFASEDNVYHFEASATSAPNTNEVTRASLTSSIVAKEFADGSVGATFAEGAVALFHNPASGQNPAEITVCTRCEIVALGLGGSSTGTAEIYAASEDDVYRVRAQNATLALVSSDAPCADRPRFQGLPTGIAVLSEPLDAIPRAVFVTTDKGELRSFSASLCEPVEAVLWPTYDAVSGSPSGSQSNYEPFKVTLDDPQPAVLTAPAVAVLDEMDSMSQPLLEVLLFGASDGRLYVYDLTRAGRESWYWDWGSF